MHLSTKQLDYELDWDFYHAVCDEDVARDNYHTHSK